MKEGKYTTVAILYMLANMYCSQILRRVENFRAGCSPGASPGSVGWTSRPMNAKRMFSISFTYIGIF